MRCVVNVGAGLFMGNQTETGGEQAITAFIRGITKNLCTASGKARGVQQLAHISKQANADWIVGSLGLMHDAVGFFRLSMMHAVRLLACRAMSDDWTAN